MVAIFKTMVPVEYIQPFSCHDDVIGLAIQPFSCHDDEIGLARVAHLRILGIRKFLLTSQ